MNRLLSPEYKEDPEIERTFRILRRYQRKNTKVGVSSTEGESTLSYSDSEEEIGEPGGDPTVLAEPDIIWITNDRERNIRDYAVFDPNAI
jgi:hypothetical protein